MLPWQPWEHLILKDTTLKSAVEALEKNMITNALRANRWSRCKAAAQLELSRVGLANKIKRYGIRR